MYQGEDKGGTNAEARVMRECLAQEGLAWQPEERAVPATPLAATVSPIISTAHSYYTAATFEPALELIM